MMALVVESEEAERLADQIANETGQSVGAVVTKALRGRRERLPTRQKKASKEELLAFVREIAASAQGPAIDHGEWLYDENRIPK